MLKLVNQLACTIILIISGVLLAYAENGNTVLNIPLGTTPISATALPLPSGAATESTLSGFATKFPLTAFGDNRTSLLHPQIEQTFESTVSNSQLIASAVTASGVVSQTNAMADVSSGTTVGGSAALYSAHFVRYHTGLGGLFRFSALFTSPVSGTLQYYGIMDERGSTATFKNGLSIGYNGTTLGIQRWQNDSLQEVPRSSWDDKLDGTGTSGLNIDFTKGNVFDIQYQYLGFGAINFYVQNPTTGLPTKFHTIKYAGTNTTPSTFNPNYKATIFVFNGSTTNNITIRSGSFGYFVEGMTQYIEVYRPQFSSGTISKTGVTTETALFTIRNDSTYASKTNFIDTILERLSVALDTNSTNNLGMIRLIKNATLGGTPSYTKIHATDSLCSIDTSGTTVSGGIEIFSTELAGKDDKLVEDLSNYLIIEHPGDTVTVAVSSSNSASISGSLLWKELF